MITALVTGKLAAFAQSRSDGPSGRPFVTARLQVRQDAGDFVAVFASAADPAVMRTLLATEPGATLTLGGELVASVWQPEDGSPVRPSLRLHADQILVLRPPRRRVRQAREKGEVSP